MARPRPSTTPHRRPSARTHVAHPRRPRRLLEWSDNRHCHKRCTRCGNQSRIGRSDRRNTHSPVGEDTAHTDCLNHRRHRQRPPDRRLHQSRYPPPRHRRLAVQNPRAGVRHRHHHDPRRCDTQSMHCNCSHPTTQTKPRTKYASSHCLFAAAGQKSPSRDIGSIHCFRHKGETASTTGKKMLLGKRLLKRLAAAFASSARPA